MKQRAKQDKRSAGIHVGSASILMIFAVLCLTVFSTLSFVTAHQEQELARKSAQAIAQYYDADWRCEERYERIAEALQAGTAPEQLAELLDVQVTRQGAQYVIEYLEVIGENQQLQVRLALAADGSLHTEQWMVTAVQAQEYEDTIAVWDGE